MSEFSKVFSSEQEFIDKFKSSINSDSYGTDYSKLIPEVCRFICAEVGECPDIVYDESIVPCIDYKEQSVGFLLYDFDLEVTLSEVYHVMLECNFESIDYALSVQDKELEVVIFSDTAVETTEYIYSKSTDSMSVTFNTLNSLEETKQIISTARLMLESIRNTQELNTKYYTIEFSVANTDKEEIPITLRLVKETYSANDAKSKISSKRENFILKVSDKMLVHA